MPAFPAIGCQAVAQYPSSYEIFTPTAIQRYVDGKEQRFAESAPIQRTWLIHLERLSESDVTRIWEFFESTGGQATSFRFQDPWTHTWHEDCWFDTDSLAFEHLCDGVFQGELQIHCQEEA